jgi:SAM-dependent methyltransferase
MHTHTHTHSPGQGHEHGHEHFGTLVGLTMVLGRRRIVRHVLDESGIGPGSVVVDVGSGPGSAARAAASRGAHVIAVDPSASMRRLATRFTPRRLDGIDWEDGTAEHLPVADATADAVWAIASAHHWSDVPAGLRECRRVMRPGGRLMVVEGRVREGAKGLAAHGFTRLRAEDVAAAAFDAGFTNVASEPVRIGGKDYVIVSGRCDA